MRKYTALYSIAIAATLMLAATGCGKKEAALSAAGSSATSSSVAAANDYKTPTLTDEKLVNFIASMKEPNNPLSVIFKPGGGMNSLSDIKAKEGEFNAYAHKYGFKNYIEYIDTWGRVMVGQMINASAKMTKSAPDTSTLNGQDLALIDKYDEQITAAAKAHKGN